MNISGSFIEIKAENVEEAANKSLLFVKKTIDAEKEQWFKEARTRTIAHGFLWQKNRQLTEEEVEHKYKFSSDWEFSPKYYIEGCRQFTVEKLESFINLAKKAQSGTGNGLIYLSLEDFKFLF